MAGMKAWRLNRIEGSLKEERRFKGTWTSERMDVEGTYRLKSVLFDEGTKLEWTGRCIL